MHPDSAAPFAEQLLQVAASKPLVVNVLMTSPV
jgi:hypothetical protein